MNIKEIVEGMTAPQVAQVIKDNFNEVDKDKANKTDVNASIAKLAETVETNKAETDGKLSELGQQVIYDVSKNNDGATFASLSALLSSENLSTLIPIVVRCGGMSIRFVQSSDNNYVQYRLKTQTFSIYESDWLSLDEFIDKEPFHTTDEEIVILDKNNTEVLKITEECVNAKNLKRNNEKVVTESDLVCYVKGVVEGKQDKFEELTTEESNEEIVILDKNNNTISELDDKGNAQFRSVTTIDQSHEDVDSLNDNEVVFTDDNREEPFVKIGDYGIKASQYLNIDGTPLIPVNDNMLCLTDKIYAVVGLEMCIYADSVIKSLDRGLSSPLNFRVLWNCDIGDVHDRMFKVTPTSAQIGNHTLRTRAYDMNGRVVIDKKTTLIVLNRTSFSSVKNILFAGDSLGAGTALQIMNRFDELGGIFPNFVGSVGDTSGRKYEAYGGWRFWEFANQGRPKYRVIVSGIKSLSVNAVYADSNQHNYTITETNIDASGNGNIAMSYSTGAPIPSGTLTKVSGNGDSSFSVDSATYEGENKLWNFNTNQLDIANYRSIIGLSSKIDIVVFQLLVNDANYKMAVSTVEAEIQSLYAAFMADNPNTKILISLGTTWGNTISGIRGNGGASKDVTENEAYIWAYRKMLLEKYTNNVDYPNIQIACPQIQLDRYYGYDLNAYRTSKFVSETFMGHINYVHPNTIGYEQLSEAWVGDLLSLD